MLIPFRELFSKYNVKCKGIIQVGAHFAEEHEDYKQLGVEKFIYIEPCESAFKVMKDKFLDKTFGVIGICPNGIDDPYRLYGCDMGNGVELFKYACGEDVGILPMYVSHQNEGQSNSLLKPDLHLQQHKEIIFDDAEIVDVVKLDDIMYQHENYNFLVMDCQGYEGHVLKGATETLKHVDYIYTEINRGSTYEGNTLFDELKSMLSDFQSVEEYWPSPNWTWGDCFLVRKTLLP